MEALGGVINDQPSRRLPPAAHYSHIYPINEKKTKTDKTHTEKQGHMQRAVADNKKCSLC